MSRGTWDVREGKQIIISSWNGWHSRLSETLAKRGGSATQLTPHQSTQQPRKLIALFICNYKSHYENVVFYYLKTLQSVHKIWFKKKNVLTFIIFDNNLITTWRARRRTGRSEGIHRTWRIRWTRKVIVYQNVIFNIFDVQVTEIFTHFITKTMQNYYFIKINKLAGKNWNLKQRIVSKKSF